nr:MAG TPA: hypothetical protein [Caudoviricetes sp.]
MDDKLLKNIIDKIESKQTNEKNLFISGVAKLGVILYMIKIVWDVK